MIALSIVSRLMAVIWFLNDDFTSLGAEMVTALPPERYLSDKEDLVSGFEI